MKKFIPAARFHILTPLYDLFMRTFFWKTIEKIVEQIEIPETGKVIDVGCGPGNILITLQEKFPKANITGLDIDPHILNIAKKKIQKRGFSINLQEGSATKIPFPDNAFDVAASTLVIHHLATDEKKKMLREAWRILKPVGTFYLFDFAPPQTLLGKIGAVFYRHLEEIDDGVQGKYQEFLKEAGFHNIQSRFRTRFLGLEFELIEAKKIGLKINGLL